MISAGNSSAAAGGTGTFDVEITNTELLGGTSFDVSAFFFELIVPASAGIEFTNAEIPGTANPYIFVGDSFAEANGFPLSLDLFPNTSFVALDASDTFADVTLNPGDTFALGRVSYQVSATASNGIVPVEFGLFTELSDSALNLVPIDTFQSGQITVGGATPVVPEPTSMLVWIGSMLAVIVARARQRRAKLIAIV